MNSKRLKIDELLELQPGLKYHNNIIDGEIQLNLNHNGYYSNSRYSIKIEINYDSPFCSYVFETSGIIKDYMHKYTNGVLCLATTIDLKLSESIDCSFVSFFYNYIEPYFFSYEYYCRYGYFPFGDRAHGIEGIIDSYCDITGIKDYKTIITLLNDISVEKYVYRGHLACPCGSGIKARNCHPGIVNLFKSNDVLEQTKKDINTLKECYNEHKRTSK